MNSEAKNQKHAHPQKQTFFSNERQSINVSYLFIKQHISSRFIQVGYTANKNDEHMFHAIAFSHYLDHQTNILVSTYLGT